MTTVDSMGSLMCVTIRKQKVFVRARNNEKVFTPEGSVVECGLNLEAVRVKLCGGKLVLDGENGIQWWIRDFLDGERSTNIRRDDNFPPTPKLDGNEKT